MSRLRDFTTARVGLGRAGNSLPTREFLDFQLAHARARDAVHCPLDASSLSFPAPVILVQSAASNRAEYLRRPDLGRHLKAQSKTILDNIDKPSDIVFVIADGLSALAIHRHVSELIAQILPELPGWKIAPIIIAEQGRVAIADEIGALLNASISVILIGERPGLSSPDSMGAYLTWSPGPNLTDADRNCISNIRTGGLAPESAATRLFLYLQQATASQLTGINLKEGTAELDTNHPNALPE